MATPLILAQQVFSALSSGSLQAGGSSLSTCANATSLNGTVPQGSPEPAFPTDFSSLMTFLLSFSALSNWIKLALFGTALESCRRFAFYMYYKIYNSIFITARFEEDDSSYDWMMVWLSTQPSWKTARDVQISTRPFGLVSSAVMIEGEEEDGSAIMNRTRQLAYLPASSSVHSFFYQKHWVRVTRGTREGYYGRREDTLEICIMALNHRILNHILLEAKKTYQAAQEHMISVYVSDISNNWRHIASRPKRPLNSIVLDPGIKDLLIDDARDFLQSKPWYAARGIPFRRGYLLYGAPGSGKTSIIHSLAGELGLDVYVISLSRLGLDDTALGDIISELPEKCIALMEDIDAAFNQTLNRDLDQEEETPDKLKKEDDSKRNNRNNQPPAPSTSRITLSGLLNALDGVGAQEGRILFATTNKYSSLDPALCRPGRMDIHIEFKLASQYQARELYRCFYLPDSELNKEAKEGEEEVTDEKGDDSGYSSADEKEKVVEESPSLPTYKESVSFSGSSHRARAPELSPRKVASLADRFAATIPEREFSMAALQGYLMAYKVRPFDAVKEAPAWVEKERAERARKNKTAVRTTPSTPAPPSIPEEKSTEVDDTKKVELETVKEPELAKTETS